MEIKLSGDWSPESFILLDFPSIEKPKTCFSSPEYFEIALLRKGATSSRVIIVEGMLKE